MKLKERISYWSGSTYSSNSARAWGVSVVRGDMFYDNKTSYYYVWPVRSGQ